MPAITFSFMMYCLLPCPSLSPRGFYLSEKKSPSFLSLIAATLLHHILYSLVTLQPCFNQTELGIYVTQQNYVIPMAALWSWFQRHKCSFHTALSTLMSSIRLNRGSDTKMFQQTGGRGERGRQLLLCSLFGSGDSE